jgi:plastocyanin
MNKTVGIAVGVIALLALIGGFVFFQNSQNTNTANQVAEETTSNIEESRLVESEDAGMQGPAGEDLTEQEETDTNVKEFTVSGNNFEFDVKEIRVNQGDTVKLTFKNVEGMHDWVIDEFNAKTQVIGAGQEETIEFVADKTGTFEYYCSVGNHRTMGMVGNLIIE